MIRTNCFFCKKEFEVGASDPQYKKLRANPKASYVCKHCNDSMQKDAQQTTGLNPDMIDSHTKYL
ncbi:DUF2197 domain-containing protein [Thalassobacillus hwangdonensis]|uniref:DUF2197 domain-containing protein n=1 Tax=Thalassobacillus hwangdonensis TaxID=546108 RepID=A0ABW3L5T8_9BACI